MLRILPSLQRVDNTKKIIVGIEASILTGCAISAILCFVNLAMHGGLIRLFKELNNKHTEYLENEMNL
jgi:hypothetical protein